MLRITRLSVALLLTLSPLAHAASDWVIDALPASVLISAPAEEFSASTDTSRETVSMLSTVPSFSIGKSMDFTEGFWDFKVGGGMVINSRFRSFLAFVNLGLFLEVEPSILIGPHIGAGYLTEATWWGDADVEFSDSGCFMAGLHIAAGDKISYLFGVDYFSASFEVTSDPNPSEESELDISGILVQFGVRAQF
jgi:hypothetical protein